jgi:hypothetical protein
MKQRFSYIGAAAAAIACVAALHRGSVFEQSPAGPASVGPNIPKLLQQAAPVQQALPPPAVVHEDRQQPTDSTYPNSVSPERELPPARPAILDPYRGLAPSAGESPAEDEAAREAQRKRSLEEYTSRTTALSGHGAEQQAATKRSTAGSDPYIEAPSFLTDEELGRDNGKPPLAEYLQRTEKLGGQ